MRDKINEIEDFDYNEGSIDPFINQEIIRSDSDEKIEAPIDRCKTVAEPLLEESSKDDQFVENLLAIHEEAIASQSLPKAFLGGLIASIICILLWVLITVITRYQISYMAIGVGLGVGYSVLRMGQGLSMLYGFIGAFFSILACLVGNLLSQLFFISIEMDITFMECLSMTDLQTIFVVMKESYHPMNLLFYGIALYTGFKMSIKDAI